MQEKHDTITSFLQSLLANLCSGRVPGLHLLDSPLANLFATIAVHLVDDSLCLLDSRGEKL